MDIFFVISGYLISGVIINALRQGQFTFSGFYARRIRRIFPALGLVMLCCYAFGWFALFADEYKQLAKHMVGGAGFFSNFVLWKEAGYFDNSAETKPLLHLWSLSIEEQFYIAWPFLLLAAWKLRINLAWVFGVTFVVSFGLNLMRIGSDHIGTFYFPATRIWELAIGGGLSMVQYYGPHSRNPHFSWSPARPEAAANIVSGCGIFLVAASLIGLNRDSAFPGWPALLPTSGACLLIAAGEAAWVNRTILASRIFVGVGLISYPLYLWHWPLLAFQRIVQNQESSVAVRAGLIIASFALAWLTYVVFEKPIRFGTHARSKAFWLLVMMVCIGALGYGTHRGDGFAWRNVANSHDKIADLTNGGDIERHRKCPDSVASQMPTLDACVISKNEEPIMAIFGDSHAYRFYFGIADLDPARSWILLETNGGPPLSGVDIRNPDGTSLTRSSPGAIAYLSQNPAIKTVVLSFFGSNYLALPEGKLTSTKFTSRDVNELFYSGLDQTIEMLEQAGKSVIVIQDNPELPFQPRDCLQRPLGNQLGSRCVLKRATAISNQAALRTILARLSASHPKLRIYDSFRTLCDATVCNFESEYSIYYTDAHHLSFKGSSLVARDFLRWLE